MPRSILYTRTPYHENENFKYHEVAKGRTVNTGFAWKSSINATTRDYNHFHNILRLFDVLLDFLSPQVKRCAIISYEHGIYEFPHELPNDLRLKKISRKCLKLHIMIA